MEKTKFKSSRYLCSRYQLYCLGIISIRSLSCDCWRKRKRLANEKFLCAVTIGVHLALKRWEMFISFYILFLLDRKERIDVQGVLKLLFRPFWTLVLIL